MMKYLSEVEGKGGIRARCVARSRHVAHHMGVPDLVTLELRYPRFIHSEFMTHRMFSRNASSSRAVPVSKMIEQVENDPAMPIHWGKNQPGMQAKEEHNELVYVPVEDTFAEVSAEAAWKEAADHAQYTAFGFADAGYHKQIVNRLLEPFQFISVVVTATEWDNFFNLRLHPDAQPEIQELARCMKEAITKGHPTYVRGYYHHLPYVLNDEEFPLVEGHSDIYNWVVSIKCSVARCARVSYLNHDKSLPNWEKDVKLYDMLLEAGHMSPFEHVAQPMSAPFSRDRWQRGTTHIDGNGNLWSGNFRGWLQYRQVV